MRKSSFQYENAFSITSLTWTQVQDFRKQRVHSACILVVLERLLFPEISANDRKNRRDIFLISPRNIGRPVGPEIRYAETAHKA